MSNVIKFERPAVNFFHEHQIKRAKQLKERNEFARIEAALNSLTRKAK